MTGPLGYAATFSAAADVGVGFVACMIAPCSLWCGWAVREATRRHRCDVDRICAWWQFYGPQAFRRSLCQLIVIKVIDLVVLIKCRAVRRERQRFERTLIAMTGGRVRRRKRRRRTLSAQLLAGQVAVLVVAGLLGFGLWAHTLRTQLDQQYEQRALALAAATSSMPQVITALTEGHPAGVPALAASIASNTGASYVVIIDRSGMRYSHPNPALIGQKVEEPVVALDGHNHVGIDPGSLGRSANAKAPVFGSGGAVIGEVSAGVLEADIATEAQSELLSLAIYLAVAFATGLLVAVFLARRLKRQTFGLELDEIAALLQEREATLHGIREGVVAIDHRGHLSLLNDQAHQLLETTPNDVGRPIADVLTEGELRTLILDNGSAGVADRLLHYRGRILIGSIRRTTRAGRELGSVVTLRDRTELEHVLRELDEVRGLIDALRAQQHEFSNRMHVMSGLVELGRYEDAIGYASEINGTTEGLAAELEAYIGNARIVALLLAKTTVARERSVKLTVACTDRVEVDDITADALISVIGNLIDNGVDAATAAATTGGTNAAAAVVVRLSDEGSQLVLDVEDSGPGIPDGAAESIFTGGWSTKRQPGGPARGIGLAVVRQRVRDLGGSIDVAPGNIASGAHFRVVVPQAAVTRQR